MSFALRCYRIGGLVFSLSSPAFAESEHLSAFRCPSEKADLHIEVEVVGVPELPKTRPLRRELFTDYFEDGRAVYLEGRQVLFVEQAWGPSLRRIQFSKYALQYYGGNMTLRILDLPRRLLQYSGAFLHASYISVDGKAVLFTAPSGVGKSTQAELWRLHRGAQIVNGDRTLLRKVGGVWRAFGSPYCGTSGICRDMTCPVEAVVLLDRGGKNTVRPALPRESLAALLGGFTYDIWDAEQTDCILALAEDLIRNVPMFKLDCLPDMGAVETLEGELWPKK